MGCTHTSRVSKCFGLFGRARLFSFYILPSPNFVKYEMYFPNFQRIKYFVQSFSTFSILQRVKYIKHLVRSLFQICLSCNSLQRRLNPNNSIRSHGNVCPKILCIASLRKKDRRHCIGIKI